MLETPKAFATACKNAKDATMGNQQGQLAREALNDYQEASIIG